jgi:hypothetical protein
MHSVGGGFWSPVVVRNIGFWPPVGTMPGRLATGKSRENEEPYKVDVERRQCLAGQVSHDWMGRRPIPNPAQTP